MKFYRVSYATEADGHHGYSFHTSKAEADRETRDASKSFDAVTVTVIEIEPTKAGILEALKRFATHNNNG